MKIVVLSSHTPSLFWFRLDMMNAFRDRGHTVSAVGDQEESLWADRFAAHGIRYRAASICRNGTNPLHDLKTLLSLWKILQEEKPDAVFTYQAKTVIYGTLAANSLGIWNVYPLIAGVGSIFLAEDLKSRFIRKVLCLEYRFSMRKCPCVFFQNEDDIKTFRAHRILGLQPVALLRGSGVDLERFYPTPLPERFSVLCVARLIRDKGIMEYLEACKRLKMLHPEIHCMLIGPFDSNPSAITEKELQPYVSAGIVDYFGEQADVVPYLQQCSVFVLPSYREGTPKTVLEAMACSRAVITTDAPGCRETVQDGKNGYLVPVRNVSEIVRCVETLRNDPDLLRKMANHGRVMAETIFDVKRVNQTIMDTMKL